MILVDVHSHLDHGRFKDDLDNVIEDAKKNNVGAIITSGVNTSTNRLALELSEKYDIVKASFGLYPVDALAKEMEQGESEGFTRDVERLDVDKEIEWIIKNKDKCVGIGECGLDYHWVKDKNEEQKKIFWKIIEMAEKINKPLIVHSRKAELDAVDMLESSNAKKVVMHCFMGKKSLIRRAADNGWSFSIPPVITRLQHFQMMADIVNLSQLLTETDAPYLSPYPGERNEPAFVMEIIKKIAEIKGMDNEEVANNIWMNYTRLF
ncbi:YchF/TatD family DNA exonuclease [Candidatus Woesearchaeota archaeon]|nr:YchF/TatD family DNA exonuclease [Candidatus Woesearchaeota archaeon]